MAEPNDIIQQHPQQQEDALPRREDALQPPQQEDAPPPQEDRPPPPQEDAPPPQEDGAPPPQEDAPPPQEDAPPQEDGPPLQEDAPPPLEDGPPPQEDAPPPLEDGPPPQDNAPPLPQQNSQPRQEDGPQPQDEPQRPPHPNQDLLTNTRSWVFSKSIEAELFDFARQILVVHPQLAQSEGALGALARNPSAFNDIKPHFFRRIANSKESVAVDTKAMKLLGDIWTIIEKMPRGRINAILKGPMDQVTQKHPSRVLFVAAEMGNTRFLAELIRRYPDLMWKRNDDGLSIFHVAVSHLHESIYNLLYEIGSLKDFIITFKDPQKNNMLHLVAKEPEKSQLQGVSGVAFQMQHKLLWFKEVESMIPPHYKEQKNSKGLTPHQLFTENHKDLVSEAEKWMKGTASKCMVVAALIATVVFAVAYTIPGGYAQNDNPKNNIKDGFPVFLHNPFFLVFVVLDAISLILSSTSILVFLSILTSRYAQDDFIESLPKKLFVGLLMLFLSVVSMMLSFSVSFFVIYRGKFIAIATFVSVCALVPMASYAKLQYPLLKDVYRSTYGSRYLFKPKKQMLYYQNPRV